MTRLTIVYQSLTRKETQDQDNPSGTKLHTSCRSGIDACICENFNASEQVGENIHYDKTESDIGMRPPLGWSAPAWTNTTSALACIKNHLLSQERPVLPRA